MKKRQLEQGIAHLAIIVLACVALVGVLCYVGYGAWQKENNDKQATSSSIKTADAAGANTCGTGYTYIGGQVNNAGAAKFYKNTTLKRVCGLLVAKGELYGRTKPMSVNLRLTKDNDRNGSYTNDTIVQSSTDSGNFKYYAGPVYVSYSGIKASTINSGVIGGHSMDFKASMENGSGARWTYSGSVML